MATDFTGNGPITGAGQVWVKNGNIWEMANVTAPGIVVQTFTANGTYTPSPGMICCIVEARGGGGGGGGVDGDATGTVMGAGGGEGAYGRSLFTASDIGASQTVTIGAGGAGGAGAGNAGASGGTTSLGSLLTAPGGSGGEAGGASGGLLIGGAGGVEGTADFAQAGAPGEFGTNITSSSGLWFSYAGTGGGSGGARAASYQADGNDGTKGGGGSGAHGSFSATNRNGGDGGDGYIIITEYIRQSVLSPIVYDSDGNKHLDLSTDGRMTLYDDTATPQMKLYRDETSTGSQISGQVLFQSQNDAGEQTTYVQIRGQQSDDTDASEDGYFWIGAMSAGSMTEIVRMSAAQGGISFNGGSNYLDDYEEGTWTPTLTTGGTDFSSVTYATQVGRYTKIGRHVHIDGYFEINASNITVGSASGNLYIGGFPFTCDTAGGGFGILEGYMPTSTNNPNAYCIDDANTKARMMKISRETTHANLSYTAAGTGNVQCYFSGTYTSE